MATRERATAIRATALVKTTLLGGRRRRFRYDAMFADGHVEQDVNVDAALDGRHLPADAWATRAAAEATCPDAGPGRWVEYATGRVLGDSPPD
jgi:prepilin-type processing-associated H-X9-DG protein